MHFRQTTLKLTRRLSCTLQVVSLVVRQNRQKDTLNSNLPLIAGTDTMASAIQTFLLLLALYPDEQRLLKEEMDGVLGMQRLPDFEDIPLLKRLKAFVQETLRFNPPAPITLRSNTEAAEYMGMQIPKRTWILANIWYGFFGARRALLIAEH
jgi:cytochrome P450